MPVCDRPESPEEPISETYSINRMEQDLYELVEEQQVLLEIMARERERLERHLEMRRVLLTEQPAVELFQPQLEEIQIVEPTMPPLVMKHPNKKPKLELPVVAVVAGTSKASPLLKCSEQPLPLVIPATPRPRTRFDQSRERPVARVAPMVRECKGAKCTPPKPNGLGYDPPFPYPKRLGKSRERRAQYIFTLCDELALQLKCYMEMSRSGQESSVIIRELGVKPAILKPQKEIFVEPIMAATTGALPKSKCLAGLEKPVKRFPSKQSTISKHKTTSSWNIASIMEPEIDLDCELGMEHIEKFRYNNLREQQHNQMQASAAETESTDRMRIDNMKLALAMSELNIDEDEFAPPKQQEQITLTDWNNDEIFVDGSQPETCPSTPDIETCELLPACLLSNGCINTMPSTSAQARAMALAMLGETDSLDCSLENLTLCNFSY